MHDRLDSAAAGAEFRRLLASGPPPDDLVNRIGGWKAVEALAPSLVDEPLLTPAISLLIRDIGRAYTAGEDLTPIRPAAQALADAVLASRDPLQFTQNLDAICRNEALAGIIGDSVATYCLILAVPPRIGAEDPLEVDVVRHAVALEAVARLALLGHASKNKLLGLLEDITEPQPRRYAQAIVRTVGLAFDHWAVDDEVADVVDILTGASAPKYSTPPEAAVLARNDTHRLDIAVDAMWTKANIEVARALRGTTTAQVVERLSEALDALEYVTTADDRGDAKVLAAALRLLHRLLLSLDETQVPQDDAAWDASVADAEVITNQANNFAVDAYGLSHWSGDRKLTVLQGWSRLTRDIAWLRDQLDRDSLYEAAVVLDDILAIYTASKTYDVTGIDHGVENVLSVIRPAVTGGFAARAGLLRHLSDHTDSLRRRLAATTDTGHDAADLRTRLSTAETILSGARATMLKALEPPGKAQQRPADVPPLLAELFGPRPTLNAALNSADPAELAALAADIADKQAAADPDPDIIVTTVRKRMLAELASCEDFAGDVVPAATSVLDQLIKFLARRMNTQESSKKYLFDPEANEHHLHADLYDWLSQGPLSSATNVEVHEVGAGRVDIQITFPGFHFYLELKADGTAVPVAAKSAYIKQTVSYHASDVRIGFLIVLRLKLPTDKGPAPHLTELVSHAVVQVRGSQAERHVVMLEVPGNQTKPSAVR